MNQAHFQTQMGRLIDQFGKQIYGPERVRLIWQTVEGIEEIHLTRIVDKFIGECRLPPLLPEFREEIAKIRESLWRQKKHSEEKADCSLCRSGAVFVTDEKGILSVGRCSCKLGAKLSQGFAIFNKRA